MTEARWLFGGCCSDVGTRAVWGGANPQSNVMDYRDISSLGNATDFGDLVMTATGPGCFSGD